MYHQVATVPCDPWQLAVSPENFDSHLTILKKHFQVVSLEEMITNLKKLPLGRRMVAITFDDGFKDNFDNAAPVLQKHKLPTTFFIATGLIGTNNMFWWDALLHIFLATEKLPGTLQINISGRDFNYALDTEALLSDTARQQINGWNHERPIPNKRVDLYFKIWEQLKALTMNERDKIITELKQWAGGDYSSPAFSGVMNIDQLQQLNNNPLFRIGAHTVNHPALALQSETEQAFELNESKRVLQGWLMKSVKSVAYPYGNYNAVTLSLATAAGFKIGVSTEEKLAERGSKLLEMPRYQVKNWEAREFHDNLSDWFVKKLNP